MRFQFNPFTDKLDISGMGPGATSVDFLTGNDNVTVPADSSYNIYVLGDNVTGINTTGDAGTHTLTIHGLASSETQVGTTRYATNSEAANQTIETAALTPFNITSLFSLHPLPSSQGGTGLSSPAAHQLIVSAGSLPFVPLGVASNGQIPIGSIGSDPVLATLTAGTGISIVNGPGSITIDAMGSVAITFTEDSGTASPAANNINIFGTSAQGVSTSGSGDTVTITVADATTASKGVSSFNSTNFTVVGGDVTSNAISVTSGNNITTDASWNLGGSVSVAVSGTTNHSIQLGNASGSLSSLGVATNGQLPIGSTGSDPVLATISAGTGVSISNGPGSITISSTSGTVIPVTTVNNAASPYTVLSTDQFLAVDTSGGVVTLRFPNSTTTGRVIYVKDSKGTSATSAISVTTPGGTVTFDGSTTYSIGVNYEAISIIFDGTNYEVF